MKKLPNKLSSLLRLAVRDSKKCEKMKTRVLDMSEYHSYDYELKNCRVCMAGAVMDRSLNVPFKDEILPSTFDYRKSFSGYSRDTAEKLRSINDMREGGFERAYRQVFPHNDLTDNQAGAIGEVEGLVIRNTNTMLSRAPWRVYEHVARILEKAGL